MKRSKVAVCVCMATVMAAALLSFTSAAIPDLCAGCAAAPVVIEQPQGWMHSVNYDDSFQGKCKCLPMSDENPTLVCSQDKKCTAIISIRKLTGYGDWFRYAGTTNAIQVGPQGDMKLEVSKYALQYWCDGSDNLKAIEFYATKTDAENGVNKLGQIIAIFRCGICAGDC